MKTKLEKIETFVEQLASIFWLITSILMCITVIFGGLYALIEYLILN